MTAENLEKRKLMLILAGMALMVGAYLVYALAHPEQF